jgi:hypothetical protein
VGVYPDNRVNVAAGGADNADQGLRRRVEECVRDGIDLGLGAGGDEGVGIDWGEAFFGEAEHNVAAAGVCDGGDVAGEFGLVLGVIEIAPALEVGFQCRRGIVDDVLECERGRGGAQRVKREDRRGTGSLIGRLQPERDMLVHCGVRH